MACNSALEFPRGKLCDWCSTPVKNGIVISSFVFCCTICAEIAVDMQMITVLDLPEHEEDDDVPP